MELKFRNGEAVYETDQSADCHSCQKRNNDWKRFETRENTVIGDGHRRDDYSGETNHTAGRNISTGQYDTSADTQSDRQFSSGQCDDVDNRRYREVFRFADTDEDDRNEDDDVHCVVEKEVRDGAFLSFASICL